MGITKTSLYSVEQNELATVAKSFSHPARVAIIQHLLKTDSCINSHLVDEIGLAQATISQHLKELKSIGIIQGTIEGVSMSYCINPQRWSEIQSLFSHLFSQFSANPSSCC